MRTLGFLSGLALAIGALAPGAVAQKTWIVQGFDFAFEQVINQVNHGDTVLVRKGAYKAATIKKGVSILCDAGVSFFRHGSHGGAGMAIYQIPRGKTVRMVGAYIGWYTVIQDCPGTVVLEGYGSSTLQIVNSRRVSFNGCWFGNAQVTDSSASFSDCGLGGLACRQRPSMGCGALTVKNSTVLVGGGAAIGGDKNIFFVASPGVYLESGSLTVAGGTQIVGGSDDAPAIWSRGGTIRLGTNVQLKNTGGPLIRGSATIIRDHYPAVATAGVGTGQTFSMDVFGQPGSLVWTFASLPVHPVATPFGSMWTSLPLGFTVDKGLVPVAGSRRTSFVMPPTVPGVAVTVQPFTMTTAGRFLFGSPATIITR